METTAKNLSNVRGKMRQKTLISSFGSAAYQIGLSNSLIKLVILSYLSRHDHSDRVDKRWLEEWPKLQQQ